MLEGQQPTIERGVASPRDGRPGLLVRTPFYQGFIDDVKAAVPQPDRYWSDDKQGWWVAPGYEAAVVQLITTAFGGGRIIAPEGDVVFDHNGRAEQGRLL
jgi:hypothetical protein